MNLSDQVVSLDLAKKLKDLGVKQDSLFYWTIGGVVYRGEMPFWLPENPSAFTASELGELLPLWFECAKREKQDWTCRFFDKKSNLYHHSFAVIMVDAMAKILIHLIENGFININE